MKHLILSTDWWTDCDDAVAIRLIANAVKRGEVCLDAVIVNAFLPESVPSILHFLADCGLSHVPAAFDRDATDYRGKPKFQYPLTELAGGAYDDYPAVSPVELLRKTLVNANEPITILEIGFPQCLAALIESAPDEISPLDGCALVREKVEHLYIMAGNYANEERGSEHNFNNTGRSARGGAVVCEKWPTHATFLGWEVGHSVITGSHLPADDLLKRLMVWHGSPNGRSSWDPMTAELAIIGDAEAAGYETVRGHVSVDPATGENSFRRDPDGLHTYVKKRLPDEIYAARIDAAL